MRTFVLRARQASLRGDTANAEIGRRGHGEIIAHVAMNALFLSNELRNDSELYVIVEGGRDAPRTVQISGAQQVSLPGFSETLLVPFLAEQVDRGSRVPKDQSLETVRGITVHGFGFEKLLQRLIPERQSFLLEPDGVDILQAAPPADAVFILSDHLAMPEKSLAPFRRKGLQSLSLGPRMLFASQAVVLIHNYLDRSAG